jgi:hypothetical protein
VKKIALTQGKFVIVDDADYPELIRYKWHLGCGGRYACRNVKTESGWKPVPLHVLLMNPPSGSEVDHRNRNKLDCRRKNLRTTTRSVNQRNKGLQRNNKTGYVGVYKSGSKFVGNYKRNGKTIYVGTFTTARQAARAIKRRQDQEGRP